MACTLHLAAAEASVETELVCPGFEYLHKTVPSVPWSIHVAKFELFRRGFSLIATLPKGGVVGLTGPTEQVQHVPSRLGRAMAAINGDFFSWRKGPYQGDPMGLQISGGELVSGPASVPEENTTGTAFWLDAKGSPRMGKVDARFTVTWPNGARTPFGLNQERAHDGMVLYTRVAGASTRTTNGLELVLERYKKKPWLPLQAGEVYLARVGAVGVGDTAIRSNTLVLSLGPALQASLPPAKVGDVLVLSTLTTPSLCGAREAIGGGPVLLREGKVIPHLPPDKVRHPRSAVGWNATHCFLVVVDGRRKGISSGMSFQELAQEMAAMGCTEAMNLDGGGSAALWVDGVIRNQPSDNHERACANALVLAVRGAKPKKR